MALAPVAVAFTARSDFYVLPSASWITKRLTLNPFSYLVRSELHAKLPEEDVGDLCPLAHRTFVEAIRNRQGAAGLASSVDGNFTPCPGCEDKVRLNNKLLSCNADRCRQVLLCIRMFSVHAVSAVRV